MHKNIAVIILNWNRWQDTIHCLESLYQTKGSICRIFLVDNGSSDDSVDRIKEWAQGKIKTASRNFKYDPAQKPIPLIIYEEAESGYQEIKSQTPSAENALTLVLNKKNYGFAKGNNLGIELALSREKTEYIALINNDTEIAPDCFSELLSVIEKGKDIGACQPKMLSLHQPNMIDCTGISIKPNGTAYQIGCGQKDTGQYDQDTEIFGTCAGASLYRTSMLSQVGLFDEDFFAYFEDADLVLRARLLGWKSFYAHKAVIYHKGAATLGKDSPTKSYFTERNRYYYYIKTMPFKVLAIFLLLRPIMILKKILWCLLRQDRFEHINACVKGNHAALRNFAQFLTKRKTIYSSKATHEQELLKWFK